MLKAEKIKKSYGDLMVLKGIDIEVQKGEIVSIVGKSGAGKSTLLHILGTLDRFDSGELFIEGVATSKLSKNKLSAFRNKNLGFVFQFHHLLPEFNAMENVMIPGMIAGEHSKSKLKERALHLLDRLGVKPRASHKPSALSGGEQQRVAVARALMNDPGLILADEPSGNLDSLNSNSLHDLFFELKEDFGQSFIIVTHNEDLANRADRKLVIDDGVIVKS